MSPNRKLDRQAPTLTPAAAAPGPGIPAPTRPWLAIAIAAAVGATACGGGSSSSGSSDGGSGGGGGVEPVQPAELYEGDYQGPDDPVEMTEDEDGALAMDHAYLGYLLEQAMEPYLQGERDDCGGSATVTKTLEPQPPQAGEEYTQTTTWETDSDDGFCAHLRDDGDASVIYFGEVTVVYEGVWPDDDATGDGLLKWTTTYEDFRVKLPIADSQGEPLELVINGTKQHGYGGDDYDTWESIALDVAIPDLFSEEIRFFWFENRDQPEIRMTFASELLGGRIDTRQTGPGEFFDGVCEDGPMNWSSTFDGADANSGTVNISTANAELVGDLNAVPGCGEYSLYEHEGSTGISGTFTLLDHLVN